MTATGVVHHNVGMCPGCRAYLWAEVTVDVVPGPPTLDENGHPKAYATCVITDVEISHSCKGRDDS